MVLIVNFIVNAQQSEVLEKTRLDNAEKHYTGIQMYGKWLNGHHPHLNYTVITLYPNCRYNPNEKVYVYNMHGVCLECGSYQENANCDTITLIPKCELSLVGYDAPQPSIIENSKEELSYIPRRKIVRSKNGSYIMELKPKIMDVYDSIFHIETSMMNNGDTTGLAKLKHDIIMNAPVTCDTLWRIQVEETIK